MEGVFVIFVLVVIVMIVVGIVQSQKADESWARAAAELKLSYEKGAMFKSRSMVGRVSGMHVIVDTFSRRRGKSSTTYTRFRISYPRPLGLGLKLTREGFFSGIGKLFGAQDIEVGDASFDADIIVKGSDPRRVARYLTPARRLRIHRLLTSYSSAVVDDSGIRWERVGVMRSSQQIVSTVRNLVRVAWYLSGDREEDQVVEKAMKAQHEGKVNEAIAILGQVPRRRRRPAAPAAPPPLPSTPSPVPVQPPPVPSEPPPVPSQPPPVPAPEDEGRTAAGRPREEEAAPESRKPAEALVPSEVASGEPAARETQAASSAETTPETKSPEPSAAEPTSEEDLGADAVEERMMEAELLYMAGRRAEARAIFEELLEERPEDAEIQRWVEQTAAEDRREPESSPAKPEVALDAKSVCEALFDPSHTSIDANRIFEDRYEGRDVRWMGVLRSVESYSYDYILGSTPGTKAVLEVHEVKASLYGENKVLAVAQLPAGSEEALQERVGERLEFEGRLLKVDGFMSNIYLSGAKIAD